MEKNFNKFGGNWTEKKLEILRKYLNAYATILKKVRFYKFAYIDAFAGTGYIADKSKKSDDEVLPFFELDNDAKEYIKGSAKIALESSPQFDKYIFIELDEKKSKELSSVIENEHSNLKNKVEIYNNDANKVLQELCKKDWSKHRAVLFLDPFGMEVEWNTIVTIANTKAIDLWILFPLGVSVNRLLMKNGNDIPDLWSKKLDKVFGNHDWFNDFYETSLNPTLFGTDEKIIKNANFDRIATYYINRLQSVFSGVVQEPMYLYNSTNNPIFLLCFASGNEKGSRTAIKIAKDIMGKMS